ncbi:MAG: AMP-binding protein [Streptosporangiaceae bacterium]
MRPLLEWLDRPTADHGIRFARGDADWEFWPYERLAELVSRAAAGLLAAGVQEREVVSLVQRSGPEFVAVLFGTMAAGATPSLAAPPMRFQGKAGYIGHLENVLTAARPSLIVTEPELVPELGGLTRSLPGPRVIAAGELIRAGTRRAGLRPQAPLALLQFTSGSTRQPRGVRVPFGALEANVLAIQRWLEMADGDSTASWLPVHHDMGLIGCLLTPVCSQTDLWLLSPEQFIKRPRRYLHCLGALGATLTAMPGFGLDYIVRRVRPEALAGLDFSRWRAVIVGAERIHPGTLERFHDLCAPFGLRRSALLPAYGLAEASLAVTGLPLGEEWTCSPGPHGDPVVGCGRPLLGMSVEIVEQDGRSAEDGAPGEIVVGGPSVAAGYAGPPAAGLGTAFAGDALRTGDAGFISADQLFVLGRLGDGVKVRGRMVFAEDLEAAIVSCGVPAHRVVVLAGIADGTPTVVALIERAAHDWLARARAVLPRRAEGARVIVLGVSRGAIVKTSSGKPQRARLWRALLRGNLDSGAGEP